MSQSLISLQNADLLDANYTRWQHDPGSVTPEWASFFEGFELGRVTAHEPVPEGATMELAAAPAAGGAAAAGTPGAGAADAAGELLQRRVDMLIYTYRDIGHTAARLDPLAPGPPGQPLLDLAEFGLSDADLDRDVSSNYYLRGRTVKLREMIASLRGHYCSTLGVEFMYIQNPHVRHWVRDRVESRTSRPAAPAAQIGILRILLEAETFEHFLHTKYVGQKRFSVEGGESLLVALETILEQCPDNGVKEIVMGMAHRGRLNVLSNFFRKSPQVMFSEFSENFVPDMVAGDGDVKYHLGYEAIRTTAGGDVVEIRLAANPSHLEAVDPVVQGKARARQRIRHDSEHRKMVLPLLIHGDAAFAGQGIVAEVFNMSQLPGYRTGGTVHIIVNNQIGFTTLPEDARSSQYATDVAKMIEAPIFHVNGDDPLAVAFAAEAAMEFRQHFGSDVVIDMYCYRRYGHNEGDEPVFTQPDLYNVIGGHPSVSAILRKRLLDQGILSEAGVSELEQEYRSKLEEALGQVREMEGSGSSTGLGGFRESTAIFQPPYSHDPVATGVDRGVIERVVNAITRVPDGFTVLPKVRRILVDRRRKIFDDGGPYDWAYGETLAFGSLLIEGIPVRLSGQDSRRGTFSQRHSVMYDAGTRESYIPLLNLSPDQARFCVYNSLLSEAAVLGFDYGYSLDFPSMLCLWEAQFGDFANGAQVIIDQFIVAAESKWARPSGITLLLPHGHEGQGPEHSSARIERFLQLCADENIQVCNPTTPAQYFHLLRRQVKRPFRKPLIVMTPKSLLRSEKAVSRDVDFTAGHFREVLEGPLLGPAAEVQRLVFCSGKIYYELLDYRDENGIRDTAIVRIEQLYPFNDDLFQQVVAQFPAAERFIWCQEEPQNMGAWSHIGVTISALLGAPISYAGRDASASSAEGSLALHRRRQRKLVEQAYTI